MGIESVTEERMRAIRRVRVESDRMGAVLQSASEAKVSAGASKSRRTRFCDAGSLRGTRGSVARGRSGVEKSLWEWDGIHEVSTSAGVEAIAGSFMI